MFYKLCNVKHALRACYLCGEASRDAPVPVVPGEPVFITARSFNAGTSVCRVDVKRNTCTFALKYNVT